MAGDAAARATTAASIVARSAIAIAMAMAMATNARDEVTGIPTAATAAVSGWKLLLHPMSRQTIVRSRCT